MTKRDERCGLQGAALTIVAGEKDDKLLMFFVGVEVMAMHSQTKTMISQSLRCVIAMHG